VSANFQTASANFAVPRSWVPETLVMITRQCCRLPRRQTAPDQSERQDPSSPRSTGNPSWSKRYFAALTSPEKCRHASGQRHGTGNARTTYVARGGETTRGGRCGRAVCRPWWRNDARRAGFGGECRPWWRNDA
jgi:hypothetical protein